MSPAEMESIPEMQVVSASLESDEQPRKLAVLGLPWETTEDTLRLYFSQFGVVETAEIMKDRYTGKSRGFGFVTFVDPNSAHRALSAEHVIDGRRCEAKVALPKTLLQGDTFPARTTRIFVARIPQSVTEQQFRAYFDKFGKLQDAYMPKDHSKQAYRGIGFVTFASPDSVEKVMACKHWIAGHEMAIDRATPKEDSSRSNFFQRAAAAVPQRRSFDNGARIVGPGLTPIMNYPTLSQFSSSQLDSFNDREISDLSHRFGDSGDIRAPLAPSSLNIPSIDSSLHDKGLGFRGLNNLNSLNIMALQAASANGLNAFKNTPQLSVPGTTGMPSITSGLVSSMNSVNADLTAQLALAATGLMSHNLMSNPTVNGGGRKSLDAQILRRLENPVIASARAGPRIFIGKLTKDTTEADVKDYFMRFGYVMDVYLPKSKDNKSEHRGFGFVTFETDAAIQRVVGAGQHRLRGSIIAIDIAMPKVEEDVLDGSAVSNQMDINAATAAAANQFSMGLPMVVNGTRF